MITVRSLWWAVVWLYASSLLVRRSSVILLVRCIIYFISMGSFYDLDCSFFLFFFIAGSVDSEGGRKWSSTQDTASPTSYVDQGAFDENWEMRKALQRVSVVHFNS